MVKSSLPSKKRTLLLVVGLELWVIGIALYALLKERIVPSWDFYLLLGGSLILPIVLYFVLRKRDAIKAKNRASDTGNPHENNP
ncbi:hypothetical protein [Porphyromonas endodontalis]|uniref:hypothetical protein n=1 Tax=Porphyromonas endodontalis TaxID=28124 RepID=UPI0028EBBBD0|nr:hypothetical protein [Porphyromonas endodontalis]